MICNAKLCPNYFSVTVSVLAVVFRRQFSKNQQVWLKLSVFLKIVGEIHTTASTETFRENSLPRNFALHFTSYLSIALSKILPHSKTIKNAKNCRYLAKTTLAIYLIFYKLIFFETLIIFLESSIKSITGIFDFQK